MLERELLCVELEEEGVAPWIWERSSVGEKRGAAMLRGREWMEKLLHFPPFG